MSLEVQDNINIVEELAATAATTVATTRATLPGAVLVRPNAPPSKDDHGPQTSPRRDHHDDDVDDVGDDRDRSTEDGMSPVLVAHLAPDEEDIRAMYQQQLATEVERMRQELVTDATIVVADEVKIGLEEPTQRRSSSSRRRCGVNQRMKMRIMVGILVLVVIGAGLGGVLYWILQDDNEPGQTQKGKEQQQLDPLVEELRSFIAPTEEDLLPFSDPSSAQSKAVAWLHEDLITNTPGRTTATVLDRYVLAVFKYSTSGWPNPFLSSESVCSWTGVVCTDDIVTTLDLYTPSIFIAGTFPWELILLTNITTLDFSFSQLTGVIPTRINELTKLETLWLEHNLFSGTLLPDLPQSLTGLYLHGNQFTGTIPDVWGSSLPKLETLVIYENQLTGTLLANFPESMIILNLNGNEFTGTIPDVWGSSLPNLEELYIYKNQFTGTIPSSLGQISSLTSFEFGSNNFTGSVDSFFCTGRSWSGLIADCDKVVCSCCTGCR